VQWDDNLENYIFDNFMKFQDPHAQCMPWAIGIGTIKIKPRLISFPGILMTQRLKRGESKPDKFSYIFEDCPTTCNRIQQKARWFNLMGHDVIGQFG